VPPVALGTCSDTTAGEQTQLHACKTNAQHLTKRLYCWHTEMTTFSTHSRPRTRGLQDPLWGRPKDAQVPWIKRSSIMCNLQLPPRCTLQVLSGDF
jgi:hypothetical protein